ncbi:MAG: hypothetical protein WCG34_08685 [Leptolinea sp.]
MAIQAISGVSASDPMKSALAVSNKPTPKAKGSAPAGNPSGGTPKAASTSSSTSSIKIYDPMDTNKDGTVSDQEKAQYLLTHPEEAAQDTGSNNYTNQGNLSENKGGLSAVLNLSA